jgi:hypothetical protein
MLPTLDRTGFQQFENRKKAVRTDDKIFDFGILPQKG